MLSHPPEKKSVPIPFLGLALGSIGFMACLTIGRWHDRVQPEPYEALFSPDKELAAPDSRPYPRARPFPPATPVEAPATEITAAPGDPSLSETTTFITDYPSELMAGETAVIEVEVNGAADVTNGKPVVLYDREQPNEAIGTCALSDGHCGIPLLTSEGHHVLFAVFASYQDLAGSQSEPIELSVLKPL